MLKWAKRLGRDDKGNVLIILGMCMPLLIGSVGLAVDTIQWTLWKRQLQRAADSSALAGVYQRVQGGDMANVQGSINRDLSFNQNTGIPLFSGYPQISLPSDTPTLQRQVQVTLGIKKPLAFSGFFVDAPLITANATAASIPGDADPCILALGTDPSKPQFIVTGNSDIEMPKCWGHSNGRSANSAAGKGSGKFVAEGISASGGIQQSSTWQVNQYTPYAPIVDDPYATVKPLQADLDSKCPTGNGASTQLDESTNLNALPGNVFCFNSLRVGANKTLNLKPGTYYINGGDAFVQGDMTGTGVTIVLTNKSASPTATIGGFKVNAGSKINISAPTSGCTLGTDGCFKGMAIYQDRRAVDAVNAVNKINGNSGSMIVGALYFPNQELEYNGTGTTSAICTRFVGKRVTFSGNSSISNKIEKNCAAFGIDDHDAIRRVRLVA
jgi:Putative Flp pilus-assembly TadE/G-like